MTFVPVDFINMDMGNKTSSPIILGRPFLRTTGAIIDSKEGNVKLSFHTKSVWNTSQGRGTRRSTSSLMSFTLLNYQVSKPSYMAINKVLYGRQPGCFCFDFLCVLLL
jgi:hypothetical protein